MSTKTKTIVNLIIILAVTMIGFGMIQPQYVNRLSDSVNKATGLKLGHISEETFRLGLDLRGGVELLYEADVKSVGKDKGTAATTSAVAEDKGTLVSVAMEGLKDVIERRVNALGVREPEIQIQQVGENYHLSVKLAGLSDPRQAIDEIGKTPVLEFREESARYAELTADQADLQKKMQDGSVTIDDLYVPTQLTGRYLSRADVSVINNTQPVVTLEFDVEGARLFEELTGKNQGKSLAIFIDNQMISAPRVKDKISGGRAVIEGNFTIEQCKTLARNLNEGALPVSIQLISQKTVGPTLGEKSLASTVKAGLIGFGLVIVFMLVFYGFRGFLASLALIVYVILNLLFFRYWPGFTLTLPGIGGFILSLGMAVDANILIFARMKEEQALGKGFSAAMEEGFKRAWPAIRDGNLTTIFEGIILFWFGTGFLKGFATTLMVGVILSMASALFITRTLLALFENTKLEKVNWLWK